MTNKWIQTDRGFLFLRDGKFDRCEVCEQIYEYEAMAVQHRKLCGCKQIKRWIEEYFPEIAWKVDDD